MIMYLTRDIPAFVMYCVYGESLLIESVDSMILPGSVWFGAVMGRNFIV